MKNLVDEMTLSQEQKQRKAAACAWIEKELTPIEILERWADCNASSGKSSEQDLK